MKILLCIITAIFIVLPILSAGILGIVALSFMMSPEDNFIIGMCILVYIFSFLVLLAASFFGE